MPPQECRMTFYLPARLLLGDPTRSQSSPTPALQRDGDIDLPPTPTGLEVDRLAKRRRGGVRRPRNQQPPYDTPAATSVHSSVRNLKVKQVQRRYSNAVRRFWPVPRALSSATPPKK